MPATIDHPAFCQPPDTSARLWRYMDLARLVALLDTRSLYFARTDQLADPFEGSLSRSEFEELKATAERGEKDYSIPTEWRGRYLDILLANARRQRKSTYVNCWHLNDGESEAMWRLYATSGFGVAVQTTYAGLSLALPSDVEPPPQTYHSGLTTRPSVYLGVVQYTDHDRDPMPKGNAFHPVLHKRRAFSHEQEVRAVIWLGDRGIFNDPTNQSANPLGLAVPIVPEALIESVRVSPIAPSWFTDVVRSVVNRFATGVRVAASGLAKAPYL